MVTSGSVLKSPQFMDAQKEFTALFGGRFFGHLPDGRLWYKTKGNEKSRISSHDETEESVLQTLQDSIKSGRNLILERWPVLTDKPGCDY